MSEYLIDRINASDRITLHTQTKITDLKGDRHLLWVAHTVDNLNIALDNLKRHHPMDIPFAASQDAR